MATQVQIELTVDEKGAVQGVRNFDTAVKGATSSVKELGAATAATGEVTQTLAQSNASALEAYMAKTKQVTKAVTQSAAVSQQQVKALMAQVEGLQAMGPKAMKIFNEQITGFQKQGFGPFESQTRAIQSTLQLLEQQKRALGGVAGGAGEARIAIGAMTGSTRAMEFGLANMMGRMKGLSGLWEAAMPIAMLSAGAAIIVGMGESVYNLFEKWLDTNGAIERYNDKAAQAAQQRFFENSGIDDLTRGLQQANQQLDELQKKRAVGVNPILAAIASSSMAYQPGQGPQTFSMTDAKTLNQAQGEVNQDTLKLLGETHQRNIDSIRNEGQLAAARLSGIKRGRVEQREADREAAENQINRIATQQALYEVSSRAGKKPGDEGYVPAPTANLELMTTAKSRIAELERQKPGETGDAERQQAEASALAKVKAARIQNETQAQEEIRRLREQADEASLSGIVLLEQQRKAAEDDFVRHYGEDAEARKQIDRRYYAEEQKMAEQQRQRGERELQQIQSQRRLSGVTGAARVREEGAERLTNFYNTPHLDMNPGELLAAVHSITQQTADDLRRLQEQFSERVDQVVSESAGRTLYGFARIEADTQRQIDNFKKQAVAAGAKPEDMFRGETAIRQAGADESAELRRRNADETARIEMEARIRSLSAEKQQSAAIIAEYEERTRQYQEELNKQLAGGKLNAQELASVWTDFNRRVKAAAEERDAAIAEAAKRERDKLAGQFTSFFRNPMNALKEMGDKAAGQAAASLVQSAEARLNGGVRGTHSPLSGDFEISSIWSHLSGRPSVAAIDRHAERAGAHEAAPGVFSVSSAHIVVGSASIAFGGATRGAMPSFASAMLSAGAGIVPASFGGGASAGGGSYGVPDIASTPSGGASAGGGSYGVPDFASTPSGGGGSSVMSNLSQGAGFARQAFTIFHGAGSSKSALGSPDVINPDLSGFHFDKSGNVVKSSTGGGMLSGGFKSNIGGAAGGALGLFSAYESNGGFGGAASGALSGARLGMALGGPIGAGIGAAAGAIVGAFGVGGREKARMYDLRTVRPRIAEEMQSYQTGGANYISAYSDLQSLDMDAKNATNKMGPAAQRYYQETIKAELRQAEGRLTGEERGGRSNFGMQTAQFDTGADYIPRDGYAVIHKGESIFTSDRTERVTRAMEAMPSIASVAAGYRMAMTGPAARVPMSGGDRTLHMNVNAIDARSVAQFFNAHKHVMRAALNASYAENSGGADA